jgi:hypothetical protein
MVPAVYPAIGQTDAFRRAERLLAIISPSGRGLLAQAFRCPCPLFICRFKTSPLSITYYVVVPVDWSTAERGRATVRKNMPALLRSRDAKEGAPRLNL